MTLNPDILTWARDSAGLSRDQAAETLGFKNTRARSATERLAALEAGVEEPSRSVLLRMAKAYRRSLLVFYLHEPPRTGDRGRDFRTIPGARPPLYDPILDALIRDIRGRQVIVKSLLDEAESQKLDFVGSATMEVPAEELARRIGERIGFSLREFRGQATAELAFNYLREKVEGSGIFVLLLGNLGSYHTNIPVETFRGFAIADVVAPLVVVNDQDSKPAWSFTALHEVAHLWLGTTGVSGANSEARIEQYCNDVAGEALLPTDEVVADLTTFRGARLTEAVEAVSTFARSRKISRAMVAYKLLRSGVIHKERWGELRDHFRKEWLASKARQDEADRGEGGPNYYVVKRHRLGPALLDLARHSLGEGLLTYTKAGQLLGVKPRNVEPLLRGVLLREGR